MSIILENQEEKTHQRKLTMIRLILLLLQIFILLSNRTDQTSSILFHFPDIGDSNSQRFKQIQHDFSAANTMALFFVIMQLLILYVGTNRFKVKPTIFSAIMYVIGCYLYYNPQRWQYEHIWNIYYAFSFVPLCSEIAVALYTAKR